MTSKFSLIAFIVASLFAFSCSTPGHKKNSPKKPVNKEQVSTEETKESDKKLSKLSKFHRIKDVRY